MLPLLTKTDLVLGRTCPPGKRVEIAQCVVREAKGLLHHVQTESDDLTILPCTITIFRRLAILHFLVSLAEWVMCTFAFTMTPWRETMFFAWLGLQHD